MILKIYLSLFLLGYLLTFVGNNAYSQSREDYDSISVVKPDSIFPILVKTKWGNYR